ncbi:MAG: DUF2071 domain-containing protein [Anaerolineae bacterium]|nr:DUF2071 domain-containing protein [Anaerolineae bacterium]
MRLIHDIDHRAYPPPDGVWLLRQTWSDLAFLHWQVPAAQLQRWIPAGLQLDTYDGAAWIGIVPFQMSDVSLRGLPALPLLSYFPEMNVRTYVIADGKPGVFFFSLDAGNPLAVLLGRRWYRLPYFNAEMTITRENGAVDYYSQRRHRGQPNVEFSARYRASSAIYAAARGSLDHWLTERYCLYTTGWGGELLRGEIQHRQWELQRGEAEIRTNTLTQPLGIELTAAPLVHFVQRIQMIGWLLARVSSS